MKKSGSQAYWSLLTSETANSRVEVHRLRLTVARALKAASEDEAVFKLLGSVFQEFEVILSRVETSLDKANLILSKTGIPFHESRLSLGDKTRVEDALFAASVDKIAQQVMADLQPPLGWRGGPCKVVERIVDNVKSPPVKDSLVDKVEGGQKLTNPEAATIYKLEVEKGMGLFNQLRITSHAQYRMDQRGVTVGDVQTALKNFGHALNKWKSTRDPRYKDAVLVMGGGRGTLEWVDKKLGDLVVVISGYSHRTVSIVTTYWKNYPDPKPRSCDYHPRHASVTAYKPRSTKPHPSGKDRQRSSRGEVSRYYSNHYRENRGKLLGRANRRHDKLKSDTKYQQKRQDYKDAPEKHERRPGGPRTFKERRKTSFIHFPTGYTGEVLSFSPCGYVHYNMAGGRGTAEIDTFLDEVCFHNVTAAFHEMDTAFGVEAPLRSSKVSFEDPLFDIHIASDDVVGQAVRNRTKKRQRKSRGADKQKRRRYYRKNKQKQKRRQKQNYKRNKRKPSFKKQRQKYRQKPQNFSRRYGHVLTGPYLRFLFNDDEENVGTVRNISGMTGYVQYFYKSNLYAKPLSEFMASITFLFEEDIDLMFDLIDAELGLEAYEEEPQKDRERILHYLFETDSPDVVQEILGQTDNAKKASSFFGQCAPELIQRSKNVKLSSPRTSAKGVQVFKAQGASGHYDVSVLSQPTFKVACTCPFWTFGGPEHWAKKEGYLLGSPQGTATKPSKRDPQGVHKACKHVLAVLTYLEKTNA